MVLLAALATATLAPTVASAADTPGTTRRCATQAVLEGVNVSEGQTVTSWASVKAAGKSFGYAKARDGIAFADSKFVEHYQGMKAAGITPGGYLFLRSWADPTTQARLFVEQLQAAGYAPGDLLPVIDVEKDVNSTSPVVPRAKIIENLRTAEAVIQEAIGAPPVIYTGPDYWAVELGNPTGFASNPLWIANYVPPPYTTCPEVPHSWSAWKVWQYERDGEVPGIAGKTTNLNRSNGPLPIAGGVAPAFYEKAPPDLASVGAPYTYRFGAYGVPAPTYAVHAGSLPPGVSLDAVTGALTGAPTTPGAYEFVVRAQNGVGPNAVTLSLPVTILVEPPAAGFHSMVPYRVLDSRGPTGGWNGQLAAGEGNERSLVVTGASGVPTTASAVVMNVTAVESTKESFVTVYPGSATKPITSNLNFGAGQINANLVTVRIGAGGVVQFATAEGATHVVADIVGWYDDGTGAGELFNGLATPARILDTRTGNGLAGRFGEGQSRVLQVAGRGGVPADATSVILNLTAVEGSKQTFLQAWPATAPQPNSSNLNVQAGQILPNLVTVKLGPSGRVAIYNDQGSIDVVGDVVGWYGATGSHFYSLPTPTRIVDSRIADGLAGRVAQTPRAVTVTGRDGIPEGATGLVANVTVADGDTPSYLSVFPGSEPAAPLPISNLNFGRNQVVPNLVVTRLPVDGEPGPGQIKFFNGNGYVYVIADAVGYFAP